VDGIADASGAIWLVAIAGLVIGALGCVLAALTRRRNQDLGQRLQRIEDAAKSEQARQARLARPRATIERDVVVRYQLAIHNDGHGEAKDVTISIDGAPLDNCPLVDAAALDLASTAALGAHGGLRIPLETKEVPERLQIELTWTDASGELGFYQAELRR
jgi:hypothetical protein